MPHMHPEISSYEPEQRPEAPDINEQVIRIQTEILSHLSSDQERMTWIEHHAARFRSLVGTDAEFRALVEKDDVDAIVTRLESERRSASRF